MNDCGVKQTDINSHDNNDRCNEENKKPGVITFEKEDFKTSATSNHRSKNTEDILCNNRNSGDSKSHNVVPRRAIPRAAPHPYLKRYRKSNHQPKFTKCKLNCGMEHPETKSGSKRHEKVCPKFQVKCPLSGCKTMVLRKEMDQHVASVHRKKPASRKQSSGRKPWHKKDSSCAGPSSWAS